MKTQRPAGTKWMGLAAFALDPLVLIAAPGSASAADTVCLQRGQFPERHRRRLVDPRQDAVAGRTAGEQHLEKGADGVPGHRVPCRHSRKCKIQERGSKKLLGVFGLRTLPRR